MLEVGAFAEREKDLADVVLQVIVNSYMEKVQKWKGSERIMCEALRVLMADELNEERVEGRIEGQREGRLEGQREGRIEGKREGQIQAYASLIKDGIITVEIGAEKAGMSVDDFVKEMKQIGYLIPVVLNEFRKAMQYEFSIAWLLVARDCFSCNEHTHMI